VFINTEDTLNADEMVIERAHRRAMREGKTLSAAVREWLWAYAAGDIDRLAFSELMGRLDHVHSMRCFSRHERNQR
jgi:hypothetical protein